MDKPLHDLFSALERRPNPKQALTSSGQLNKWVTATRRALMADDGVVVDESRLSWIVASAVVVAVLQRVRSAENDVIFLLKGGTYLQYRLGLATRATRDVDGLIRGDFEQFFDELDAVLRDQWGDLEISRTEFDIIDVPGKAQKPRRFTVKLSVRGAVWRSIKVEVSPDEGGIGTEVDRLASPPLQGFGIPTPEQLFGIALRGQIAQKLHAVSDPHVPPAFINERARDLVDLLLIRQLVQNEGLLTPLDLREICVEVFESRRREAEGLKQPGRTWPPVVVAHTHWASDYRQASAQANLSLTMDEAVAQVNHWIAEIVSETGSS
ncbi:MAG: nucleotidyl transferase AbiEii/AbiGii toxin family protein [Actinomycetes bacterium]